jgi:hypothetical protein
VELRRFVEVRMIAFFCACNRDQGDGRFEVRLPRELVKNDCSNGVRELVPPFSIGRLRFTDNTEHRFPPPLL